MIEVGLEKLKAGLQMSIIGLIEYEWIKFLCDSELKVLGPTQHLLRFWPVDMECNCYTSAIHLDQSPCSHFSFPSVSVLMC